ncbi:MAG: hypothetical protein ACXAB2_08435, partial [Candidatus Hodarchaeales archaeon]
MEKRLENYLVILLFFLVWIPFSTIDMKAGVSASTEGFYSSTNTELIIRSAELLYQIHLTGGYICLFTLEVIGNNLTEVSEVGAQCKFIISDLSIENFTLLISNTLVDSEETKNNTCSFISFSTMNLFFPENLPFTIKGSFKGKYSQNASSIYTYNLGIDWGTTVGSQHTEIRFEDDYSIISVSPVQPIIESTLGDFVLSWTESITQGFSTTLELHPRQLLNVYLIVDFPSCWNATIGQTVNIPIHNIGTFDIDIVAIVTPDWISTNVSKFKLIPSQKIIVTFTINSLASSGMNGSIDFIIWELRDPINIPVTVLDVEHFNGLFPFLVGFSLFTGLLVIGMSYYQRDSIKEYINQWKKGKNASMKRAAISSTIQKNFSEKVELTWESLQSRWEPILPEQELQVLKILFDQGVINQKMIADQLGVS